MGLLLVLGLALLQALTGTLPSHRIDGWQEALRAPVARAVRSVPSDAEAVVHAPGSLYQALRVSRGIAIATLDRTIGRGASGGGLRVPSSPTALPQALIALHRAPQSGNAARVIASRGSLLPYFPTAPPITG